MYARVHTHARKFPSQEKESLARIFLRTLDGMLMAKQDEQRFMSLDTSTIPLFEYPLCVKHWY